MQMGLAFAGLVVVGAMAMAMYELFSEIERGAPPAGPIAAARTPETAKPHAVARPPQACGTTVWNGNARSRATNTMGPCVSCKACTRKGMRFATEMFWCIPPGGLVGGDSARPGASAWAKPRMASSPTPGATRFYRSDGAPALQRAQIQTYGAGRPPGMAALGEAVCRNACLAENRLTLQLAPGAQFTGLDVIALGSPHAGQPFEQGRFLQHIDAPRRVAGTRPDRRHRPSLDAGRGGRNGHACLGAFFLSPAARWPGCARRCA